MDVDVASATNKHYAKPDEMVALEISGDDDADDDGMVIKKKKKGCHDNSTCMHSEPWGRYQYDCFHSLFLHWSCLVIKVRILSLLLTLRKMRRRRRIAAAGFLERRFLF